MSLLSFTPITPIIPWSPQTWLVLTHQVTKGLVISDFEQCGGCRWNIERFLQKKNSPGASTLLCSLNGWCRYFLLCWHWKKLGGSFHKSQLNWSRVLIHFKIFRKKLMHRHLSSFNQGDPSERRISPFLSIEFSWLMIDDALFLVTAIKGEISEFDLFAWRVLSGQSTPYQALTISFRIYIS